MQFQTLMKKVRNQTFLDLLDAEVYGHTRLLKPVKARFG